MKSFKADKHLKWPEEWYQQFPMLQSLSVPLLQESQQQGSIKWELESWLTTDFLNVLNLSMHLSYGVLPINLLIPLCKQFSDSQSSLNCQYSTKVWVPLKIKRY
jgi:hypothetical protein